MPTLEAAIALAATAHEGQTDKAGAPYIFHLLRVMQAQRDLRQQNVHQQNRRTGDLRAAQIAGRACTTWSKTPRIRSRISASAGIQRR